jgi:hypothetical protein
MLRRALLAMLLVYTPVLSAKERILLYRIGPSQSTLFIANADGSDERPMLPNSGFDYNASFSPDGKWIIFTSERGGVGRHLPCALGWVRSRAADR